MTKTSLKSAIATTAIAIAAGTLGLVVGRLELARSAADSAPSAPADAIAQAAPPQTDAVSPESSTESAELTPEDVVEIAQNSVFETPSLGPTFEPLRQFRPDFFEESQERLDSEIEAFQQNRSAPTFGLQTGFLAWQPAVFRNGGFTVWMPPGVLTEELERIESDDFDVEFDVFAIHTATSRFVVAYAERPDSIGDTDAFFSTLTEAAIARTEFALTESQDVEFEALSGVELELADEAETIALRILLSGDRVYLVGIRQPNASVTADTATAFLDSFQLL